MKEFYAHFSTSLLVPFGFENYSIFKIGVHLMAFTFPWICCVLGTLGNNRM